LTAIFPFVPANGGQKKQSAARLPGREYHEEIMHELADTGLDGDQ
jgi:hypothetical protein